MRDRDALHTTDVIAHRCCAASRGRHDRRWRGRHLLPLPWYRSGQPIDFDLRERTAEGGETYAYPAQYGATCAAHDADMPPTCSEDPAPAWCAVQWCFVDPAECSVDMVALSSAYWDHVELYISYETCQQPAAAGGTAGPHVGQEGFVELS